MIGKLALSVQIHRHFPSFWGIFSAIPVSKKRFMSCIY